MDKYKIIRSNFNIPNNLKEALDEDSAGRIIDFILKCH